MERKREQENNASNSIVKHCDALTASVICLSRVLAHQAQCLGLWKILIGFPETSEYRAQVNPLLFYSKAYYGKSIFSADEVP